MRDVDRAGAVVSAIVTRLEQVRIVIAHGYDDGAACPDGLAAALIVKDVLPDVEVRLVAYESRAHSELAVEPGLFFVDIGPPRERVTEFVEAGAMVLDHHKSAKDVVEAFGELGVYSSEPGVSAAILAHRHVWAPLIERAYKAERDLSNRVALDNRRHMVTHFARLAGIRDTWQKGDPLWREACEQAATLAFFPVEEWLSERPALALRPLDRRLSLGPTLMRKNAEYAAGLISGAYRFVTEKGTRVVALASAIISDAAEAIEDADVVVGFSFRVRGGVPCMKLSFRSRGGFVVRRIAERLGGGGHDAAASAWIELHASHRHPYEVVRTLLDGE